MRPLKRRSGFDEPSRSSRTSLLCIHGRAKCTRFRRSGKSTIKGQRSTSPFRKASSELVPVSTHSSLIPARFAASFTVSTARPEKPFSVRIWTGGLVSKPMRRGRGGIGGNRVAKYHNATAPTIPAASRTAPARLQAETGSTLTTPLCEGAGPAPFFPREACLVQVFMFGHVDGFFDG